MWRFIGVKLGLSSPDNGLEVFWSENVYSKLEKYSKDLTTWESLLTNRRGSLHFTLKYAFNVMLKSWSDTFGISLMSTPIVTNVGPGIRWALIAV